MYTNCVECGCLVDLESDVLPDLDDLPEDAEPNTWCLSCALEHKLTKTA